MDLTMLDTDGFCEVPTHFIRILDKEVSLPPLGFLGDKPIFCIGGDVLNSKILPLWNRNTGKTPFTAEGRFIKKVIVRGETSIATEVKKGGRKNETDSNH